ncbi:MAG: sodium:solute symporter [Pseudomonadota bacterium]
MESVSNEIALLDLFVIVAYLALIIGIGVWVSRSTKSGEDLFLAGRSLAWGTIGFSLFASNISTSTLIGLTGSAYGDGIAVSAYEWMAGIPLLLLAFVFAPLFLKSRITTTPEYLDLRYSRRVRLYFSGLTIVFTVIVDTAGGLYAGAVVMQVFFPEIEIWMTCVAIGLFAGIYTAFGGLKAVVFTDVLQSIVLLTGCAILAFMMFRNLGFSWADMQSQLPDGHLSVVKPIDDPQLPWFGLFFGVWLLGFWYWVTNQYIVQRVLGAKDLKNAQWGAILGGMLKLTPLFIMVLPGAMAVSLLPDIPENDQVFPIMITEILPAGLTGLVLAGLIAAIMSSVDSTLNSSSTLIVHDFISDPDEELAPEKSKRYGQMATITFMIIAIAWAPLIQYAGGLWDYLQQMFSVLVPPLVVLFLGGALWRRGTGPAAFYTLIIGHGLGASLFVLRMIEVWPLHYTINVVIMTVVSAVIFVVFSLLDDRHEVSDDVIWTPKKALDHEGGFRGGLLSDVRLHAAVLVASIAIIAFVFW